MYKKQEYNALTQEIDRTKDSKQFKINPTRN